MYYLFNILKNISVDEDNVGLVGFCARIPKTVLISDIIANFGLARRRNLIYQPLVNFSELMLADFNHAHSTVLLVDKYFSKTHKFNDPFTCPNYLVA
jgi:hypothetical protein